MTDELLSLHHLITQDIADDDRRRNDTPIDADRQQENIRHGYRIALDYVEHEIRMMLEQRENGEQS